MNKKCFNYEFRASAVQFTVNKLIFNQTERKLQKRLESGCLIGMFIRWEQKSFNWTKFIGNEKLTTREGTFVLSQIVFPDSDLRIIFFRLNAEHVCSNGKRMK